jgi:mono/diheme cytochrome c family protein
MKSIRRGIKLAAGLAVLGALGAGVNTAIGQSAEELFDGKWRYRANCAGCHHESGNGIYAFGPALKGNAFVQNAPAPVLIQVIQKGRNYGNRTHLAYVGMPAFPYIRAGEAEALVQYMKGELQE